MGQPRLGQAVIELSGGVQIRFVSGEQSRHKGHGVAGEAFPAQLDDTPADRGGRVQEGTLPPARVPGLRDAHRPQKDPL